MENNSTFFDNYFSIEVGCSYFFGKSEREQTFFSTYLDQTPLCFYQEITSMVKCVLFNFFVTQFICYFFVIQSLIHNLFGKKAYIKSCLNSRKIIIYVTSFYSISYCNDSEYWSQKSIGVGTSILQNTMST